MSDSNPYSAPTKQLSGQKPMHALSGTMVRQIRVVAILMIVLGVIEIMVAIYFIALTFLMPVLMAQSPNQMPAGQQEVFNTVFFGYFFVGGAVAFVVGALRIAAGILGVQFRGRWLGIVSHVFGLIVIVTFYCFPTAIGICVYGCIIYFNRNVAMAFDLRKEGRSCDEVLDYFRG